jgi:ankyrin repeat protein
MKKQTSIVLAIVLILGLVGLVILRPRIRVTATRELVRLDPAVVLVLNGAPLGQIQEAVKKSGKRPDEIGDPQGTLLFYAVEKQRVDVAEWLLEQGADANGRKGGFPLYEAILNDDAAMVKMLVRYGADPDRDLGRGATARREAETSGNAEVLAALRSALSERASSRPG